MRKIPIGAKRVFSGVIHDVYQWDQPDTDGKIHRFECLKRKPSVAVIAVTDDNKVLLIDETQPYNGGYTTIPGGIAEGHDYEEEALRELLEETGYAPSKPLKVYGVIDDVVNYSKLEWKSYIYLAHGCKKVQRAHRDASELIITRECEPGDFIDNVLLDSFGIDWLRHKFDSLIKDGGISLVFESLDINLDNNQ